MASSQSGRDLHYFAYGDIDFAKLLENMMGVLIKRKVCVSHIWKALLDYHELLEQGNRGIELFDYLFNIFDVSM